MMGIFNKFSKKDNDKDKDRFLNVKLSESRYNSLEELIIGEVSVNSSDSKLVTITYGEEQTVSLWVAQDKIIGAVLNFRKVEFKDFLYWLDGPSGIKSILITDVKELTPDAFPSIASLAPALLEELAFYSGYITLESLKWADEHFAEYTAVTTEIFKLPQVTTALAQYGVVTKELNSTLAKLRNDEDEVLKLMGVADIDFDMISLSSNTLTEAASAEEKVILAAAASDSTLEETLELANGFSTLKLLEAALKLAETDVIDVSLEEEATSALPDLVDAPKKRYEQVFIPTHLGSSIYELAAQVFQESGWKDSILGMVSDNEKLEQRIDELESKLLGLLAKESFADFDKLENDIQDSIRFLLNERESHSVKRIDLLTSIQDQILVQDFELEEKLDKLIDEKLAGIEKAVTVIDLMVHEPEIENDFELDDQAPEFNFNDAVIDIDHNGDSFIREIEHNEEVQVELDASLNDALMKEFYGKLSQIEKASLGVTNIPARGDTIPPIFIRVAKDLGLDPLELIRN